MKREKQLITLRAFTYTELNEGIDLHEGGGWEVEGSAFEKDGRVQQEMSKPGAVIEEVDYQY